MAGGKRSILLVDDDAALVRALGRVLRQEGFQVARTSSVAVARSLGAAYDVGVFDIEIGADSGVDLARELLASAQVRDVVFFSGTSDSAKLARALTLGPVLSKTRGEKPLIALLHGLLHT